MSSIIKVHDCSKCKLRKQKINVDVDPTDLRVYHQIQVRMDNSKQAIRADTINALGDSLSEAEKEEYFRQAFKNDDEAQLLFVEWWELMKSKYHLDDSTKVDFEQKMFFQCLYPDGTASLTGDFIPKEGVDLNML